ncbi:hypothetical protein IC762_18430 [Bradyrhizobium genosp. L]|uniref:hypothetical protein n=1 Tax=Bradyrhizobium genosp. L TaxID=83637 RepID=UPI0018A2DDEE|nr:hypothetical protein [Bradyrhizobium genosp. L]QPF81791.1 hypothetical protein IC762_18430 [Bradyrhizobium genosp. L]
MKYVALVLGTVAMLAVAGIAFIWRYLSPKDLDTEIAKSLLSVLTASVVTQAVAIVVYQYNESRKTQADRDAFRARVLDRINEAFVKIKGLRRKLRAQATLTGTEEAPTYSVSQSLYQETLEEVNDIQLGLEVIAKDVETNSGILKFGKEIFRGLRSMEEYLNEIVDEWEHLHAEFEGEPAVAQTSAIPKFNDLLGPYKTSQFRPLFVHAYYETIERVRASMTDGSARRWQMFLKPFKAS